MGNSTLIVHFAITIIRQSTVNLMNKTMQNLYKLPLISLLSSLVIFSTGCATNVNHDAQTQPAPFEKVSKRVIVDTDMAIDDWTAVLYVLSQRETKVDAITITGAGEVYCKEGMRNALHLIEIAGRADEDIIVACGDSEPMDGFNVFPDAWRNDANTLVGMPITENLPEPSSKHAVQVLQELLINADEPIDIITLGNLTNLAQLVIAHPDAAANIKTLFIMGGAFNVKGNIIVPGFTDDNLNKVAEWNIYIDPVAAEYIFNSNLNTVVVPLDATNQVMVTHEFAHKFKQHAKSASAKFQDSILDRNKEFISSKEYFFWDPLTAAIAFYPDLCRYEIAPISVNTESALSAGPNQQEEFSKLRYDGTERRILSPELSGQTLMNRQGVGKAAAICISPDAERFKKLLIEDLNS